MRIGQSHRDVAIVLLGAFSRYVNYLQDDEIALPQTRIILKALRMLFSIDLQLQISRQPNKIIK
jgi:hypothetical protein